MLFLNFKEIEVATSALGFFEGFGHANCFTLYKLQSDEMKQGKNYYLSAIPLTFQWMSLARLNSRLISYISSRNTRMLAQGLSGISICLSLPTALFLACVKHSHYQSIVSTYNHKIAKLKEDYKQEPVSFFIRKLPQLSTQLSNRTCKGVHFLADHAGDMMQIAMIIAGIGLSILGQISFARGLFMSLTYAILDARGWIPRKVSLFMETYASLIGSAAVLYAGTWFGRAVTLPLMISFFPKNQLFMQSTLDSSISWCAHRLNGLSNQKCLSQGPSLAEIDEKFSGSRNLTYAEIKAVIESGCDREYEINVSHCTNFVETRNLPKDYDFSKLLQFFQAIDWTQKFDLLKAKLSKEDCFIDFLQENYVDVPKEELKKNIDSYIANLAKKKKISKEEYAVKWVEEQMSALVNILTGNQRGKGSQQDLQEAIDIGSEIVAYLQNISERVNDTLEYEDALLKLALEAGNYCNRGIKRVFSEMQPQVMYQHCSHIRYKEDDPIKQYELNLLQSFENLRYKIVLKTYQQEIDVQYLSKNVFQDIHIFDIYRKFFTCGFYPFTKYERKAFSMLDVVQWRGCFKEFLPQMYEEYRNNFFDTIEENGNESFYIEHKIINQNPHLNESQKKELRNWYGDVDATGDVRDITEKSRYLLLLTMGILRPLSHC